MTDIDRDDRNSKCCDEYSNIEIGAPVLYNNSGSCEVVGKDNRVFEKVVPTCSITSDGQPSFFVSGCRRLTPELDQQIELHIQRSPCLMEASLPSPPQPS